MKAYKNLIFETVTKEDVTELTTIMKQAFDADSRMHLGKAGGPPGYDNGEFIRRNAFAPEATAYKIIRENKAIGMIILWIDPKTNVNFLGTIFIDKNLENKGIGKDVWEFVEREYPDTVIWRTETPVFSHRIHSFYINKLGFHVVAVKNPKEWRNGEGQFLLEKKMK